MAQAVQAVRGMLQAGGVHQLVTANGAMLVRAARDERVRHALNSASLAIADGIGVVLAARILGRPAFPRVPGVELAQEVCAMAAAEKWRVFLLGAAPGVAAAGAEVPRKRYPGPQVVGVVDGDFRGDWMPSEVMRPARPHVVF